MILSIFVACLLWFFSFSQANQCPPSNYCSCSQDLTIITCTNRQINDQTLIYLQNQFPPTTIVLNLSSNVLTSIVTLPNLAQLQTLDVSNNRIQSLPSTLFSKFSQLSSVYFQRNLLKTIPKSFNRISNIQIDLSLNPLNCQCHLKWLIKWFETINLLNPIDCQRGSKLTENDFCLDEKENFQISPDQSQLVYENDPLLLNCSSKENHFWTLNENFISTNSTIFIEHLKTNHSGLWTCHSSNSTRSINVHVFKTRSQHFCPSIFMETSKGSFRWPRTLTGQTIDALCPFGSAAWFESSTSQAKAFHSCSSNRQWIDLDLSQCAFRTNFSREFDRILSKNQTNLLSKLVAWISKADLNLFQFDDIVFLIDLIDEENDKYRFDQQNIDDFSMFIYRLTDYILQVEEKFQILPEYQAALKKLRSILERLLDLANRSWLYVGKQLTAMTLESPLPPTVCFVPNRPLLTIICGIVNREYKKHEARLATLQFLPSSNKTDNQTSVYRIIIYRQGRLFNTSSHQNLNPTIYLRSVSGKNGSSVKITFHDRANRASIRTWNSNETLWSSTSSSCQNNQQNSEMISTECFLLENQSLAVTFSNDFKGHRSLLLNQNYLELAVSVSSIIATLCFLASILFYIVFHNVYLMPRSFFHCLVNYWFSLTMIIPLFAFGIRQTRFLYFCQFISVGMHYFCLTTIIWLCLLSYCIWQKLYVIWSGKGHGEDEDNPGGKSSVTIVDYDDDGLPIMKIKPKPIIQFYFLAYGISFIICGINVAISRDQYVTNTICFLNNFESMLTVLIPIGVFGFLAILFLLAARLNIRRLTKEAIRLRDLPDEPESDDGERIDLTEENILSSKPNETVPIMMPSSQTNVEQTLPHIDCRQSHLDSLCSSDMDHQHQPSNQLLSILFQLILLILIFLCGLSIYVHPLDRFNIRFEHSLYSHLYGFFVLLLAFYVLSFYVLSRSDLTLQFKYQDCFFNRKKKRLLNQSYSEPPPPPQTPQQSSPLLNEKVDKKERDPEARMIYNHNLSGDESFNEQVPAPSPPHSHYSSSVYNCQMAQTADLTMNNSTHTYGSKYQASIASKYYARHRHMLKNSASASETSLQKTDSLPLSKLKTIEQESSALIDGPSNEIKTHDNRPISKSINHQKEIHSIPIDTSRVEPNRLVSPRMNVRPPNSAISPRPLMSPSQAIIRPLPIVRLSSPNVNVHRPVVQSTENSLGRNSFRVMPSPTSEERHATYIYLNKNSNLIQQTNPVVDESSTLWKKTNINGHHPHVAFIDEDEEGSVSLKSTSATSSTASITLSRKERSQTLSSSSSDSSKFSNKISNGTVDNNQVTLHESSV